MGIVEKNEYLDQGIVGTAKEERGSIRTLRRIGSHKYNGNIGSLGKGLSLCTVVALICNCGQVTHSGLNSLKRGNL